MFGIQEKVYVRKQYEEVEDYGMFIFIGMYFVAELIRVSADYEVSVK